MIRNFEREESASIGEIAWADPDDPMFRTATLYTDLVRVFFTDGSSSLYYKYEIRDGTDLGYQYIPYVAVVQAGETFKETGIHRMWDPEIADSVIRGLERDYGTTYTPIDKENIADVVRRTFNLLQMRDDFDYF